MLVFLSARQRRSEAAAADAAAVWRKLNRDDLALVFATADTGQPDAFRRLSVTNRFPVLLDAERRLYGDLGLIVLPTTIVIDSRWRLGHVISSYQPNYAHRLEAYAQHALGELNDEQLAVRLTTTPLDVDSTEYRIAQHRSAAQLLRELGLMAEAEAELKQALAAEPTHAGSRLDLASIRIAQGRVPEAAEIIEAVLATEPGHRRGRLLQGVVFYHSGKLEAAESVLTEMLVFNADPVLTHYYLGLVYEQKGDAAAAIGHYRQSLQRVMAERPL